MTMATDGQDRARDALRRFAARDFEEWSGLARQTSLADVASVFDVDADDEPTPAVLGSDEREVSWMTVAGEGYPDGVRVWMDGDEVVLLDGPDVELPRGVQPVVDALGTPEARLDSYLMTFRLKDSEWVYPDRGITLYVNPENMLPLRVAAFAPTTLDAYQRELRMDLEVRRLPLRRDW